MTEQNYYIENKNTYYISMYLTCTFCIFKNAKKNVLHRKSDFELRSQLLLEMTKLAYTLISTVTFDFLNGYSFYIGERFISDVFLLLNPEIVRQNI